VTLVKLLAVGCAFLLGQAIGASGERGDRFFRVLLVLLAAFAAWAFISFLADPNGLFGHRRVSEARRLAAAFGSPNNAATLFGAGALLATGGLAGVIGRFGGWRGAVGQVEAFLPAAAPALVCLLFCVVDLLLSASRAGIAATGLCLFVLVLWEALGPGRGGPAGRGALTAAAAGVAVLAWLALSREQVIDRFASASDDFEARRQIFEAHWRAVTASPWLGYGLGVFDDMNRMLLDPGNAGSLWKPRAAHNVYLQWLEAAGVVGAVPMFAAVGCAVVAITAGIGRRRRTAGWMRAVVCVSLLIAVHGFTDYALETPSIALFWALLLGVGAGLGDGARR
jgi:O-antigen ligase